MQNSEFRGKSWFLRVKQFGKCMCETWTATPAAVYGGDL